MQRGRVGNFFAVVEIRTKLVSLSSFLLGTFYPWWRVGMFLPASGKIPSHSLLRGVIMFLSTLCVDMGTTAWNTYFDYLRGTDDPRVNREPDKVLIHGELPPSYAFWTAFWLYIAAMVGGLVLSFQVGFWILPVGAVCMAVGFFYNAGPLPISHTPVGELFAGGFLGSGLFLISWGVQIAGDGGLGGMLGRVGIDTGVGEANFFPALGASIPGGLAVASILAVNNACDVEGDQLAGRKTFAVLFGRTAGEALALGLALLASLGGVVLSLIGVLPGKGIYTFPVSVLFTLYQFYRIHQAGFSHSTKSQNMKSILQVFGVWSLAYGGILLLR